MHAAAASTPTRTYALAALPPLPLQEALGQFAGVLSSMPTLQHLQLTLQCPGATSGSDAVFQAHAMTALTSLYLPLKDNSFSGVVAAVSRNLCLLSCGAWWADRCCTVTLLRVPVL